MALVLFPLIEKIKKISLSKFRNRHKKQSYDWVEDREDQRAKLEAEFLELEQREKSLLNKYKYDWKLYHKFLKRGNINYIYHFTDKANISSIIENQGLYSFKSCVERGLKITKPGGDALSQRLDRKAGLDDFIRLSFTEKHPMMFYALNEGRISDPVVLKINPEVIYWLESKYSDRNATSKSARIGDDFNSLPLNEIDLIRNVEYFDSPEEYKNFYQAEILVKHHIPLKYIENIDKLLEY